MSIYVAHRRRKTSNALDTLVLSEQGCFQWTSERLVTTCQITEVSRQRIPSRWSSDSEGPTTKWAELVTQYKMLAKMLQQKYKWCHYFRKNNNSNANSNACSWTGGADVLYNKFNVTSWYPPVNPPRDPESDYNCVVATSRYWRLSRCTDRHSVVCQSG